MTDMTPQRTGETRDVELEGLPRWVYKLILGIMLLLAVLSLPQVATQWLACSWPWFWQPITGPEIAPGCLALNEFGDLLAGAFAPLAFGGLIYTVLMQRDELRAQRRELKISQDIASEQRTAMEEQQKALALQASIMEQTARLTNEQEARRDLDTFASMIRQMISSFGGRVEQTRALSDLEFIRRYIGNAIAPIRSLTGAAENGGTVYMDNVHSDAMKLASELDENFLQQLDLLNERLSAPDRLLFAQYRMTEFAQAVRGFQKALMQKTQQSEDASSKT
ncbi:hypothetical protein [Pannonibacter sp. SL95]|uniref:hypothetical protein n=1 Tax=Pannonibacter sp. SL95 TaxID=2995153 RepID=UPI002274CB31|nr:hypothetical protein [Pannonibacter sp. SL95]MCY1705266.1 hypothetical protein [Pannonibacter sp. SL95]